MDRTECTPLPPDIVISKKLKEDNKPTDKVLKPIIIKSPVKQRKFKNKIMKNERSKEDQSLSLSRNKLCEIKNPNELSQPRIKRRRVLSSAVHNSHSDCATKELDINFPFSPIYKRTRSFHKKTLPISNLAIQQKITMQEEKGWFVCVCVCVCLSVCLSVSACLVCVCVSVCVCVCLCIYIRNWYQVH